ncbi:MULTISPECIES: hypothetical protein [unclassified Streptomyces]|uniref:hypothetical protein n=1 Tax=unclassified Streptomyces TaxID=2593676 RepID=UPI002253C9E8|nr:MULTISPECIES: hypothetical protein [unclassified Streptomyces]WSP53075.1 hypothetical protein OG306_00390 [Streptomyces sp. NBC_01241]MCX4791765.1 hypothetical protein [Streptomyces sp. NBC_01221]MCX4799405.1 hypothetical protein [Streptomyces sp. NBC_01242]WSJ40727.1 hypothetical protein OG772_35575 [Streptomyces sp. NBC_01321]WSP67094.1 hypothetical protein OG466_38645 [Streptomyces sp. NBC_01240]
MALTTILAVIGGIVIIIGAAARVPKAVAELIQACIPVVHALNELRVATERNTQKVSREEDENTPELERRAPDEARVAGVHSRTAQQ